MSDNLSEAALTLLRSCSAATLTTALFKRGFRNTWINGVDRLTSAGASPPTNLIRHHAVDLNVPIACGGVAVYPGDILVGDDEGVVVILRHLAAQVAEEAVEQERLEDFVMDNVRQGESIFGLYPPDDDALARYQASKKSTSGQGN